MMKTAKFEQMSKQPMGKYFNYIKYRRSEADRRLRDDKAHLLIEEELQLLFKLIKEDKDQCKNRLEFSKPESRAGK